MFYVARALSHAYYLAVHTLLSYPMTAGSGCRFFDHRPELATVEPWTSETTEQAVRTFAERKGAKLGAIAQPLRAALTGRTTSPGIFEVLAVLGKAESLARIADQTGSQSA